MSQRGLQWAVIVWIAWSLAGCGLWTRDTSEPPAPLPEFSALGTPAVLWSTSVGSGGDRFLWQVRPGLTAERVIVADAGGRVAALDRKTGRSVWENRLERVAVASGVGVGNEIAVVGTLDGTAIALSVANGQEVWRTQLSSEVLGISDVAGTIVVARTNDGRVHGLDSTTGTVVWTVLRTTPALSLRGAHEPALLPGRVLTGFDTGRLLMLGLTRGNVLWEATVAVPQGRSDLERMVDADGHVPIYRGVAFASSYQGRLAAVAVDDGSILWVRDFSSYRGGDISPDGQVLVMTAADSHVWGLDPRGGADYWQQRDLRLRGLTAPVVVGDQAVVGDFEGYLHWLALDDGRLVARTRVGSAPIVSRPVLADGVLYAVAANGRVAAVRARVGSD